MTKIQQDTDDIFYEIVRLLDNATTHISARGDNAIDHTHGIMSAGQAWILAEMTIRSLDDRHIDDKDRFREARETARKLVSKFWQFFKLFPLSTTDGRTAMARVVDNAPEKGQYVMTSRQASAAETTSRQADAPEAQNHSATPPAKAVPVVPSPAATNGNGVVRHSKRGSRGNPVTPREVLTIRKHFADLKRPPRAEDYREVATMLGRSPTTIYNIVKGYSHTDVR